MSRLDDERIADILEAADELALVVARGYEAYEADPLLRRAAERLLGIIGEAAKGVSEERRVAHPDAAWKQAARLRDLLAHQYFRVDPDQVWTTASLHIPVLANILRSGESRGAFPDRFRLPDDIEDDGDDLGDTFGLPR